MTPHILGAIRKALLGQTQWPEPLSVMSFRAAARRTGCTTLLVFAGSARLPVFVVRVALNRAAREPLRREFERYKKCRDRNCVLQNEPLPILYEDNEYMFTCDPYFEGHPLGRYRGRHVYYTYAVDWLVRFHRAGQATEAMDSADVVEWFQDQRRVYGEVHAVSDAVDALLSRYEKVLIRAAPAKLPATNVHGDFSPTNVLIRGDCIRVVDWEHLDEVAWGPLDLWYFILTTLGPTGWGRSGSLEAAATKLAERLSSPFEADVESAIDRYVSGGLYERRIVQSFAVATLVASSIRDYLTGGEPSSTDLRFAMALDVLAKRSTAFWSNFPVPADLPE